MSNFERGSLKKRAIAVAVASCYLTSAQANPTGASVAAGNVVFDVNGKMLTITNTPGAIINWQQFSIQKDEITRFIQQNASSAVLNRVGGANNPSYILGTLRSELTNGAIGGRVFLVNPSGITFGAGSVINVGGLVASTLGMSDADFATAAAGGRMRFIGAGGESELRNAGEIRTAEGGHVYLVAPKVVNEGPAASNPAGGVIASPKGEIIVAAGTSVELVNAGTPDIRVELTAPANEVVNAGKIVAASGRVGIYGTLIRNSGLVSASAAALGEGGKIVFKALKDVTLDASSRLEANGAKGGDVTIQAETGTLLARGTIEAKGAVEKGGKIHLLGSQVGLVEGAQVDASGLSGGGTVLVGGGERGADPQVQNADAVYLGADTSIRADALESGDGGKVVVYSKDATRAYGSISARGSASGAGGSVETSGGYLEVTQAPDVGNGGLEHGGTWLIGASGIEIAATGTSSDTGTPDFTPGGDTSHIGAAIINSSLNAGNGVTVDAGSLDRPGTQPGNITVNAAIESSGSSPWGSLNLNASNDINVNAGISIASGGLSVSAGRDMNVNASVRTGSMFIQIGNELAVVGNAGAPAELTAFGGQQILAGSIDVRSQGGNASIQNFSGDQQISVGSGNPVAGITVRTTAPGGTASIFEGAGMQVISAFDAEQIGVDAAFGNAVILSHGDQQIINFSPDPARGNIRLANSTTGFNNSFAGILAPSQNIFGSGNVTLTAGFAAGTSQGVRIGGLSSAPAGVPLSTNLNLSAGGNVVLTGGSGAVNGAALGTSAAQAQTNFIAVNAGGSVIMNSGPDGGTRIGSGANALADGNITVIAGSNDVGVVGSGSIQMNGTAQPTAIRTLGSVTLQATSPGGTITQGANGSVRAGTLTTSTDGSTSLTGPNQVSRIASATSAAGNITVNNTGPLSVTNISAPGSVALNNAGALTVAASGTQNATISSGTGQTITAQSLSVTAQDGRTASIISNGGAQNIAISGGNIDVIATSGNASISTALTAAPGASQVVTVTNGDRINVNGTGAGFTAGLNASGATQTISITGTGANAITVGSTGALGTSSVNAASQSITAGTGTQAGSISVTGADANNASAFISAPTSPVGAQTISTSGALNITGGRAPSQLSSRQSGVFNTGVGQQNVTAASISVQGGASGSNNGGILTNNGGPQSVTAASITVQGGASGSGNVAVLSSNGDQTLNVTSSLSVAGGVAGTGNSARVSTAGNQTISGNPAITVAGGGGTNNTAAIAAGIGKVQAINAAAINVFAGNGLDSSATITGATQSIKVLGGLSLNGSGAGTTLNGARIGGLGGAAPSDTNLSLDLGGNLVISGGAGSGAGLGSTVTAPDKVNNITVRADGSVILNSGTGQGVRIGTTLVSPTLAAGDISITAGDSIQLNGNTTQSAAIRTTGNVSLTAGTISETARGLILGNSLTLKTTGNADLTGTNQVSSLSAPTTGPQSTLGVGGNLSFNNASALNVGSTTVGGALSLTTTSGDVNVTNRVTSGGAMNVNAAGALNVNGAGLQDAMLRSSGGQTITAQSVNLTAQNNRRSNIENVGTGNQTITATAGGMNLQALGGSGVAQIINSAPGASQTVSMSGLLNVVGGTTGVPNGSRNSGIFQNVNALQQVSSSGITLQASGTGTSTATASGALISSTGSQTIDVGAGSIGLVGGAGGSGNSVFISSNGDQSINAGGTISITGGTLGSGNRAGISTNGNQTITGNANIAVTGGASGGVANNGNFAFISGGVSNLQTQTINAGSISVTSGAGGIDNSATILGAKQVITTTGNFTVSGSGSSGPNNGSRVGGLNSATAGATDLTLNVGGDVILTAGANANGAGSLASSNVTPPFDTNITVNAAGSVILNAGAGSGSRIGSSNGNVGGGNISVTAGNSIQLNGNATQTAAIRTTGNVSLTAGTISETANGLIIANNLTVKASGNADLTGQQNRVSSLSAPTTALPGLPPMPGVGGTLSFNNTGALNVGSTTVGGALNLTTTSGDLNVTSVVTSGPMTVNAAGALNVNGGGLQDAMLRSSGGQTITAQSVNLTAQNNRRSNIENQVSGSQTITATAGGMNLQALGGSGVAQIANSALGGSQTVSMTGLLNVLGGTTGVPNGSRNSGIFQTVNALQKVTASGITLQASGTGTSTPTASGALINSAGSQVVDAGAGTISLTGGAAGSNNSASISNSNGPQTVSAGSISLQGGAGGVANNASISSTNGGQTVTATNVSLQGGTGSGNVASVRTLGTTGDQVLNVAGGSLTVTGGTIGNGNQAAVSSVGNQSINGNPNITVTGGASGGVTNNANNAVISATNAGKQQTINAGSISVTAGAGGTDNSGTIIGATQVITATGNVTVTGGATTGTSNGSRIGGQGGASPSDTNLTLTAGGDVVLTGGSADGSGARLGSSATTSALTNNVTVNAGGSVILNGGTAQGAAIGYSTQDPSTPPAGGTISVTAGNAIQLNGGPTNTSIRTIGDVTLNAGTISEGTNGFILANNLTLKTAGDATLTGPNQVGSLSAPSTGVPPTRGVGGNLSFNNTSALNVGSTTVGGALSLTTTSGDLNVTSVVTSGGAMNVNAAGALNVNGAGLQDAMLRSSGGQTITAQSVNLTAQNNRRSNIENQVSGSQTITATAGGMNLQALGGSGVAQIANSALGGSQTVSMSGQLNVLGGTTGVPNGSRNSGIFQTVNALQKVTASGITLQASGTGTSNATASGALISSSGSQSIDVGGGSISLVGGAGGANNSAGISSSGDQVITAAGGGISLTGGTVGINNRANISSGGNQTINGNPDITVTGGASGGVANSANSATISAGAGKVQTINAGSISVTAGAGGIDNSGTITGATQSITATGNVTVTGGATTGTSNGSRIGGLGGSSPSNTNLTLNVGGDLILTGGSADGSGARLGSSATTSPLTNNVTVNAGGSVILNGGTAQGAAIGYSTQDPTTPPAGGTISVSAGNSIQLNGGPTNTSIRTLGDVTLTAGTTISEGTNGFILANRLTTSSGGDTTLIGPNRVSSFSGSSATGSVTLNNIGALAVNSVVAANNAALTNLGAMSVNGPMSAGGTLSVTADSVNGAGNIATGGGFTVNVAGESLLSGVISGAGGLNKLGAGTLTVSGDNTYAGETDVLAGTLALGGSDRTNSGVVNIFSGATYRGSAGTFNNAGVIEGDGTLDVSATTFTNSGTLRPGGSGAIGTLTVSGNAIFGPSSLIDIEAQGAGNGNHDVLAITGAASLGGNLNVTHINGYAPLTDDAITPVAYASRTGTLGINPDSWLPTYNPAGLTLGFDPNVNRWIGTSGNWNVAANWSRGHTPLAFETALIDVAGNQLVTVSDGARAAGKLRSSEDFLISGGSLSLGGPSFFYGALSLTGGTLQGAGSITVNGAFNWSGGSLGGSGQFITAPGAMSTLAPSAQNLLLGRTWLNQGHVTWQSSNGRDLVIAEGASLVNTLGGEFTLAAAHGGNIKGDGVFRNEGTVTMNGADKTAIKTSFTNSATGVLNVNSGALKLKRSASNEGSVRIAAGATLELKQDYINYGRLSGNGILDASGIRFTNLGVLAPGGNDGLGIGTFTIRGDYHQGSTGVLDMGLGGVAAGQYDVLAVSGKAFLDGTLQTSAVNGYVPVASDSFKLITYKSRSGAFSALTAPAGLTLDADYTKRFGIFELE